MTGRTGGRARAAAATRPPRPSARGEHDVPGADARVPSRGHARPRPRSARRSAPRRPRRPAITSAPARSAAATQRARPAPAGRPRPRAGAWTPPRTARAQARLQLAALAAAAATRRRGPSERISSWRRRSSVGLVAVEGDVKRAAAAGSRRRRRWRPPARRRTPARRRARRAPSAAARSSPQVASPTGASIPAATPDAPAPGRSRSSTRTARPALGGAPGAGEADRAGADDDQRPRLRGLASACASRSPGAARRPPSLRRHYPDQVQTVGGRVAALSALGSGSRYGSDGTPGEC